MIAALLGHANLDTVMVYAKLYPRTLVEEYRKAVRGQLLAVHGPESLRNPTAEEWAELSASCEMRDMGTHLCALPTGDHCSRGLVCLGCNHAQPKRSAATVFARMATSHKRELAKARKRGEPAGQDRRPRARDHQDRGGTAPRRRADRRRRRGAGVGRLSGRAEGNRLLLVVSCGKRRSMADPPSSSASGRTSSRPSPGVSQSSPPDRSCRWSNLTPPSPRACGRRA